MGINIYLSSAILLSFTGVYTILGGLTAVIYTELLQCIVMIVGGTALSFIGFQKVGGIQGLWEKYPHSVGVPITTTTATTTTATLATFKYNVTKDYNVTACYGVVEDWAHIFRPFDDPAFPWLGVVFSLPIIEIWYWCTDQVIVQRTLGARNLVHAQAGTIFAGFLKILPMFIMVMPGRPF